MNEIKLLVPDMPPAAALAPYLARVDAARWYTNFGPLVRELEERLGAHFAADDRVATLASGTAALELALQALGLPDGARVLLPDFTFVATATAVMRSGCRPVVADVDPQSWLLTPEIARRAIAERPVDAVMPVATFGCPQDAEAWDRFSGETGLPVVIDAAGAFGNQRAGRRAHVAFSLHATKALGAGEGGFVVSRDAALIERIRRLSNFGIDVSTGIVDRPGTNAKLSEYHAAVALAALERWPERAAARRAQWRTFLELMPEQCPSVTAQARPVGGAYTIAPVLLPAAVEPVAVIEALARAGVQSRRWYCPPLSHHPGFAAVERAGPREGVKAVSGRVLGVPFHLELTRADLGRVFGMLRRAIAGGTGGGAWRS
ncbi:MAG: DegT/DnrJ/EryC1/StrS family aminotransferase [Burkholderiales bacterium]|nr:DegT/DnrJ/EryC1/StrS family aminotransferase [Burkholderiales bacterium]